MTRPIPAAILAWILALALPALAESLKAKLGEIAELQAKIRLVHLRTHIAQAEILTPEQIFRYNRLRGYGGMGSERAGQSHGGH